MPENTAQQETTPQGGAPETFVAPQTQAELDEIIKQRLTRERAKYAGFDEYKAKAAKFDEMEAASKTELEKATERAQKAEAELSKLRAEAERTAWNASVAEETRLPVSVVAALNAGSLDELTSLAKTVAEQVKPQQTAPGGLPYTPWDKKSYQQAAPKQSRDLFAEAMAERFNR